MSCRIRRNSLQTISSCNVLNINKTKLNILNINTTKHNINTTYQKMTLLTVKAKLTNREATYCAGSSLRGQLLCRPLLAQHLRCGCWPIHCSGANFGSSSCLLPLSEWNESKNNKYSKKPDYIWVWPWRIYAPDWRRCGFALRGKTSCCEQSSKWDRPTSKKSQAR